MFDIVAAYFDWNTTSVAELLRSAVETALITRRGIVADALGRIVEEDVETSWQELSHGMKAGQMLIKPQDSWQYTSSCFYLLCPDLKAPPPQSLVTWSLVPGPRSLGLQGSRLRVAKTADCAGR
jgi:hypothetical protein